MKKLIIHNHFPTKRTNDGMTFEQMYAQASRMGISYNDMVNNAKAQLTQYEKLSTAPGDKWAVAAIDVKKMLAWLQQHKPARDVVSNEWEKAISDDGLSSVDVLKATSAEEYRLRKAIKDAHKKGDGAQVKTLEGVLKHVTGRGSSAVNMAVQKETAAANPPPLDAQPAPQLVPSKKARDISEGVRGMMERKAAMIAKAKEGEERMNALLIRITAARKIIKKRGDTPYNGYAAEASRYVTSARASFGLVVNQLNSGMLYKFDELMAGTRNPEKIANEATQAIERQASEHR